MRMNLTPTHQLHCCWLLEIMPYVFHFQIGWRRRNTAECCTATVKLHCICVLRVEGQTWMPSLFCFSKMSSDFCSITSTTSCNWAVPKTKFCLVYFFFLSLVYSVTCTHVFISSETLQLSGAVTHFDFSYVNNQTNLKASTNPVLQPTVP